MRSSMRGLTHIREETSSWMEKTAGERGVTNLSEVLQRRRQAGSTFRRFRSYLAIFRARDSCGAPGPPLSDVPQNAVA